MMHKTGCAMHFNQQDGVAIVLSFADNMGADIAMDTAQGGVLEI